MLTGGSSPGTATGCSAPRSTPTMRCRRRMMRAWRASGEFRGALERPIVALPHRHQRVPGHPQGPPAPGPPDGARTVVPPVESQLAAVLPDGAWVSPIADDRVLPPEADPAELAEARDSIRLAFVAALQHLPPRQRAVLILCEVLRWQATEAAELLDTSVPAVNSALQRARATLASIDTGDEQPATVDAADGSSSRRMSTPSSATTSTTDNLLREDAIQSMPPYAMWLEGATDIGRWMLGPGHRLPRVQTAARPRQRIARLRSLQAGHARWVHPVGHQGHRDVRGPDLRDPRLPGYREALPRFRPAARTLCVNRSVRAGRRARQTLPPGVNGRRRGGTRVGGEPTCRPC